MANDEYLNSKARNNFVTGIISKFDAIQSNQPDGLSAGEQRKWKAAEDAKFAAVKSLLARWNGEGTRDVAINRAEVEAALAEMPGRNNPDIARFIEYIEASVTDSFDRMLQSQRKQTVTEQKEAHQLTPAAALEVMKWYEEHITYDSARKTLNVKALAGASEPHLVGTALKALGSGGHSYDGKGVAGNDGTVSVSNAEALAQTLADNGINFQGRAGLPSKRTRAGGEG